MMAVSSHEDKMLGLHHQLQENQRDLQEYISDLGNWEEEIKAKEQELLKKKSDPQALPPVRNTVDQKKYKKKKKKKPDGEKKPKRISGFDFQAWDKFDVDKALEEVDGQDGKKSSSEYETDEEWELERKKYLANEEKNKGNSHLSAGAYEVAIECYSRGMDLDPSNALLPANRALALIKLEKYGAAEVDCTSAIAIDPLYVKAYLRRAAARVGLQRIASALEDYQRVLQLEPTNKQAQAETERIKKEVKRELMNSRPPATSLETAESSEVKAVYKPPEQRSKKPLRRIQIEEIGLKDGSERKAAIAKAEAQQSKAKKETEAKDQQMFEKFTHPTETLESGDTTVKDKSVHGERDLVSSLEAVSGGSSQPISKISEISYPETSAAAAALVAKTPTSETARPVNQIPKSKPSGSKPNSPRENVLSSATVALGKEPPQTSFQFQADFKVLKNDLPAFYLYFKRIDPIQYPKLFGQSLEAPVLLKIMETIRECGIPAKEDCFEQLKCLSQVKRFSMITMFMSAKEKQGIRDIFQYLKTRGDHPESDIDALIRKYEV